MIGAAIYEAASEDFSMEEARNQPPPVKTLLLLGLAGGGVGAPYVWIALPPCQGTAWLGLP